MVRKQLAKEIKARQEKLMRQMREEKELKQKLKEDEVQRERKMLE